MQDEPTAGSRAASVAVATAVSSANDHWLRRHLGGTTRVETREVRILGAAMLGVAAIRPLIPIEFVPPCPLRSITGIPCPLCGMTRGVTALVHGDFARADVLVEDGKIRARSSRWRSRSSCSSNGGRSES